MMFAPRRSFGLATSALSLALAGLCGCDIDAPPIGHFEEHTQPGSKSGAAAGGGDGGVAQNSGNPGAGSIPPGDHEGGTSPGAGGPIDAPPAAGRGATVPYFEYEAEDTTLAMLSGGSILKWDDPTANVENTGKSIDTFEALEASGRSAVKLHGAGQSVSFTLKHKASSIVVRYSIPDSPDGNAQAVAGRDNNATLGLYVNGVRQDLHLTSRYSWTYGTLSQLDQPSIANQSPGGDAHHVYDEVRALFPSAPPGTVIKLQQDAQDQAAFYVIDLVDFEDVAPPLAQPADSISITDAAYGAIPNDGIDDSDAIKKAIADATSKKKVLWIPPGAFTMAAAPPNLQNVKYNQVPKLILAGSITIQGAGMWYSKLEGFGAQFEMMGRETSTSPALAVTYELHDFALSGDVTWRKDADGGWQGFDGPWGKNSKIENVWIEHTNVGIWLGSGWQFAPPITGPLTQNLTVRGVRIRNTYADGINMADGTTGSLIEHTNVRNSGDDSLVTWSYAADGSYPCQNNVVQYNTVQTVWHANCYALYGGKDNHFENNTCADTANMAGVFLATDFNVIPFDGNNTVAHTTLTRAGGWHGTSYDYAGEGALMFFATPQQVANFSIEDVLIDSPVLSGIQFSGGTEKNVSLNNITVQNYGTQGIEIEGSANGAVTFENVSVSGAKNASFKSDGASLTVNRGSGNTGW